MKRARVRRCSASASCGAWDVAIGFHLRLESLSELNTAKVDDGIRCVVSALNEIGHPDVLAMNAFERVFW
jgi:hypothetical protein